MKPLQSIAMGLVIVVLVARFHGYDALPDPVGWLLVLLGVRALPPAVPHRDNLLRLAGLAGAVSVVVWFPAVTDALYDADASLAWAANLPEVLFGALLCHALAATADEGAMGSAGADSKAARWLRLTRTGMLVVAVLPVLVFGAGLTAFETTSYVAAGLMAVLLICLLFTYAGRSWAVAADAAGDPSTTTGAAPPEGGTAPEA
jgi:hypothetical protein